MQEDQKITLEPSFSNISMETIPYVVINTASR
jgi:hypothetical protein